MSNSVIIAILWLFTLFCAYKAGWHFAKAWHYQCMVDALRKNNGMLSVASPAFTHGFICAIQEIDVMDADDNIGD